MVILSTSAAGEDVSKVFDLGATVDLAESHGWPAIRTQRFTGRNTGSFVLPGGQKVSVTTPLATHGLRVLVVDDDLDDQFFSQLALEKILPAGSTVQLVHSGNAAIAYMIGEGKFSDRTAYPFPSLVITDLKMADGDGFHVLEFLQKNPAWNVVPRLMFSNSAHDDDVRTAFMLGASAYHIKPMGRAQTEQRMRSIVEYWAGSEVPPVDRTGRVLGTNSEGRLGARYAKPAVGGPAMERP